MSDLKAKAKSQSSKTIQMGGWAQGSIGLTPSYQPMFKHQPVFSPSVLGQTNVFYFWQCQRMSEEWTAFKPTALRMASQTAPLMSTFALPLQIQPWLAWTEY